MALVELLTVNDIPLAHILHGRLQSEGITSALFDLGFSGLLGGGYPGVRVMVDETQEAQARLLLELPEKQA